MKLMLTYNYNIIKRYERFATRHCFNSLRFRVIWRICGTMARQAQASRFVLERDSHSCSSRHSITGGMDTKERRRCSSRNGRSPLASSWDITSRFGQTDTHSSQKSRDPLCHLNAHDELWSHQTTLCKNALERTQHCSRLSDAASRKSISTNIHSSTSNSPSSHQTDSPTTSHSSQSNDMWWYWENGGEL